jgi:hypothetical protein
MTTSQMTSGIVQDESSSTPAPKSGNKTAIIASVVVVAALFGGNFHVVFMT